MTALPDLLRTIGTAFVELADLVSSGSLVVGSAGPETLEADKPTRTRTRTPNKPKAQTVEEEAREDRDEAPLEPGAGDAEGSSTQEPPVASPSSAPTAAGTDATSAEQSTGSTQTEDAGSAETDQTDDEPDGDQPVSLTDLQTAAAKVIKAGKREELKKVLASYKASALSEVSEDDRPKALTKMEALLDAAE